MKPVNIPNPEAGNELREKRVSQAITYNIEKKVLTFLARHTPSFLNPDHFTILAIIGAVIAGASYYLQPRLKINELLLIACLGIFLHWLGDSLDGTLARFRHIEKPRYGYYVDHLSDMVCLLIIMLGLGFSDFLRLSIALGVVIAYYLLSINSFLLMRVKRVFQLSFGRFGPTEARISLILTTIFTYLTGSFLFIIKTPWYNIKFTLIDLLAMLAILFMIFQLVKSIVANLKILKRLDNANRVS
ncbi:CDP-alcohol phosphatidyltransferase family protein [Candidatus Woesearchaeota archaeon]|nr:CDP-alcohol phosphatidyltransferase family protein [Candidatus Woesearchaeota archaeon]